MNNPTQQPRHSTRDLKIMIVSTPKTGNTWLRHLLAAIYDLPTVQLGFPFGPESASALGERWIMHQHYTPEPLLLDWARRNNIVLITTTRHPGDVLLSLYHYVHSYDGRLDFLQLAALAEDDGTFGAPVRAVLHTIFKDLVALSVAWQATGMPHMVEYEALYFDPVAALTALTNVILPVSRDCIERAVEQCDIHEMRALAQDNRAFFRQGVYGGWRKVLPPAIVDLLRTTEPYPVQFAALGYTLDAQDQWSDAAAKRPPAKAGFFEQFGHSPAMTSLLKSIYLSFDSSKVQCRWPNLAHASMPTAFHLWLNQPAEDDPAGSAAAPLITNIAAHIHRLRTHLYTDFPDLYGQNRADFVFWFLEHAAHAYQLDDLYIAPMRTAFNAWAATEWAIKPDSHDPIGHLAGNPTAPTPLHLVPPELVEGSGFGVPVLTYLAGQIYRRRPDLRAAFPDVYGRQRIDFLRWMITYATRDYALDPSCIAPLRRAFIEWAIRPDAADSADHAGIPVLTNLAAYIYQQRPDLRAACPDVYGQHRIDFIRWVIAHAVQEYHVDQTCVAPLRQSFNQWAVREDAADSASQAGLPVLTNLAVYIYQQRPDLQAACPDLYGRQRIDLVRWVIAHAVQEYHVDQTCVAPLRQSFNQWATQPDAHDPADQHVGVPRLTNLAAYIYQQRPDLRVAFPDAYGRQRIAFLLWLIEQTPREYQLDDASIAPLRRQFLDWALHAQSRRSHQRYDIYRFVYLSRYLLAHRQLPATPITTVIHSVSRLLRGS